MTYDQSKDTIPMYFHITRSVYQQLLFTVKQNFLKTPYKKFLNQPVDNMLLLVNFLHCSVHDSNNKKAQFDINQFITYKYL